MREDCPYLEGCPIFRHFVLESTKQVFVIQYCRGDFDACERKKLRDEGRVVPDLLLPDGTTLVR